MTKAFWVNNYFIDVSRNQIEHQQQATPIPPKALKVLEVLASRAGEVVSHEELMDIVWENSVVGPNTLQRAIAQLRKAFGDDSKKQAFIKTHAKKGYSLEANVRWENIETKQTPQLISKHSKQGKNGGLFVVIAIAILSLFILWPSKPVIYDQVTPLTASDEQEYNAAYSPDGKYLVFNRFVGQCESHLWAKDLNNNQEQRLSTEPGHYSQLSWSSDGSQLAFVLQSDCSDTPTEVKQCWQLQTLDFAHAWNGNANNKLRYDCAEIKTTHPTWLNDGRIALLQYPEAENNQPELVIYDAVSDQISQVPHDHAGRIYSLDYSRKSGHLATVTLGRENSNVVRTLTLSGEVKSEAEIKRYASHSVYERFFIKFAPDGSHFITDIEGKIYRLNLDGQLDLLHPASHTGLWTPSYHPDQTKFAVTYGTKDLDIGYLTLDGEQAEFDTISRSTVLDLNAKFQPDGNLIAFVSSRSGERQLWIKDNNKTYQLTKFEQGLNSTRYDWAPDGSSLVVNVNNHIALVNLDGSYQMVESPVAVRLVLPWTIAHKLLVIDNQSDQQQLFDIDLNTGETTDLNIQNVSWATYTKDNQIVYVDQQGNFWLQANNGAQALTMLNQKLEGNYALPIGDNIYGLDQKANFWRYNLTSHELETVATLDKDTSYISDIKGDKILATKFIGGRRELVEYSQR
ncbi:winged helix-turn-helix domain-containing protein [Pseudoalteromonas sp. MMG024]|uniref:winged helix-turn-helix domain-containing protein n=1 Tax=Pseudoalteromonas sp. MMG024 TaxID=2909980 RepID=UPI001F007EE5|nr:winged helix-turn-helix domain-containing protein [Pseudoalteromonas sp. MMG024]MCF6459224.1 winged helix-turn-helix domain-containing protein [Pseudoalteromonas sp. MMG024]